MKARVWTAAENRVLRHHWVMGEPLSLWARELPGRSLRAIYCHGRKLGLRDLRDYRQHPHQVAWRRIESILRERGPLTISMLADETHLSVPTVQATLIEMRGKACHVYRRVAGRRGTATHLWALGARP